MSALEELRERYDRYALEVRDLLASMKPTDGILGFGHRPSDDPVHTLMDRDVERLLAKAAQESPSELREALSLVFRAPLEGPLPAFASLSLIAAQRHALALLDTLGHDDARALAEEYAALYPRLRRLPLQDTLLKRLRAL